MGQATSHRRGAGVHRDSPISEAELFRGYSRTRPGDRPGYCVCGHGPDSHEPGYCFGFQELGAEFASEEILGPVRGCSCDRLRVTTESELRAAWGDR